MLVGWVVLQDQKNVMLETPERLVDLRRDGTTRIQHAAVISQGDPDVLALDHELVGVEPDHEPMLQADEAVSIGH